jgi:hypothetical protein
MSRLISALVLLLSACAVLAAPVPKPFKSGWDKPVDPDGDCKFVREADSLTIELPGGDHDLAPKGGLSKHIRFNAPRLVRDVEGDFVLQVRVQATFRSSAKSAVEGEEPSVAAGLVLIPADDNCIRFEWGTCRRNGVQSTCPAFRMRGEKMGNMYQEWDPSWKKEHQGQKPECVYLRLERRGHVIYPSLSPDGEKWTGSYNLELPDLPTKLKVGLAAYSTSTEPFKPRFDRFKLIRVRSKGE